MKSDDVAVLTAILRNTRTVLRSLTRDTELALEVLAALKLRGPSSPSLTPLTRGLVDESRFAICWNGAECHLGQTIPYRLFRRLAASPNCYLSHEQLLDDVWGGRRSDAAVRSAVRDLRRKLRGADMADLACAVDTQTGHYGLRLDRIAPPRGSHRDPTQAAH